MIESMVRVSERIKIVTSDQYLVMFIGMKTPLVFHESELGDLIKLMEEKVNDRKKEKEEKVRHKERCVLECKEGDSNH